MEYIKQLFLNMNASIDPLSFITALASICLSIYTFKSGTFLPLINERYEKLIFPLFNLLEPHLYQKLNTEILEEVLVLIEKNKSYADGKLLSIYYYCKKQPSDKNFLSLCTYIDHAYDTYCKKLKLKPRSLYYKIIRSQYRNRASVVLYFLKYTIIAIVSILIGLFGLALSLVALANLANSNEPTAQIPLLLFLSLITILFTKITEKYF